MKLMRAALLLGVSGVLALSLGLSQTETPQVAYNADEPVLLVGVLKYLARQAGYELEVPLAAPFLQRVSVSASGSFAQVVEGLLEKHAPGYRLEGAPPNFRVVKALAGTSASPLTAQEERKEAEARKDAPQGKEVAAPPSPPDGQPAQKGAKYLVIGADGTVLEGEMPKLPVAMVVDGVLTVKDGQVDLVLTPLGPACLYKDGEKVCLRALTPGLEGEIPIRLGGQSYTVRYRVVADAVVLYRFSLGGGLPAKEPEVTPKPLVPPPPKPPAPPQKAPEAPSRGKDAPSPSEKAPVSLKALPPGSWWKEGSEALWMGLSLAKATGEGRWLSLGTFRNPENAARLFSQLKRLGLPPVLMVNSQGVVIVLTPDRPEARQVLQKGGLAFAPFR
jgi:Sporulation related domain.